MAAEARTDVSVEVKICGLTRAGDARFAGEVGASYLGVVFAGGPRRQDPERARKIWAQANGRRVGVFADASRSDLLALASGLELAVLQLHGFESPPLCRAVREAGDWEVWKAVQIATLAGLRAALESYQDCVDGLLLEGRSERGRGGVGARFDWSLLSEIRRDWPSRLRLVVAGGLNPANVGAAIETLNPDVVDVSSGVERAPGIKDGTAVRSFIEAARRAEVGR